ncbi:hypothetical protein [Caballeronia sp. GAFFF1]|uniref:hypothetical protein n=1 Tax=Caballeronia sp. GAFFF1 TaxID=2921779 RepID=UPI002027E5A9|nr:hypothetical protein [Caballeronia sp. GAFFF1]
MLLPLPLIWSKPHAPSVNASRVDYPGMSRSGCPRSMVHRNAPGEARVHGMARRFTPHRSDDAPAARLDFQPGEYDHSTTHRANARKPSAQNGRISQSEEDKT